MNEMAENGTQSRPRTASAVAMAAVAVALALVVAVGMATGLSRDAGGRGTVVLWSVVGQELLGALSLAALGGVLLLIRRMWRGGSAAAPVFALLGAILLCTAWGFWRLFQYSS